MMNSIFSGAMNRREYIKCNIVIVVSVMLFAVSVMSGIMVHGMINHLPEALYMEHCSSIVFPIAVIGSLMTLTFDVRRIRHIGIDSKWFMVPVIATVLSVIPFENDVWNNIIAIVSVAIFLGLCLVPGRGQKSIAY